MKKILVMALLSTMPLAVNADETQAKTQASMAAIKEFGASLQTELQRAMKEQGPVHAIDVCNKVAPAIAADLSNKQGWDVARTSLKYRNADNAPDAWETKVLNEFEARKAKGEKVETMAFSEVVEEDGKKTFRFMKAIPTGEVCLKCHGDTIAEPINTKLNELYPEDKARGFKLGDIRGAFTIKQPM